MKIHCYCVLWNEAIMLPYFFRHYDQLVDRYVCYDNGSDDGTLELLAQHPRVEVRPLEIADNVSACETIAWIKGQVWKESRGQADLVLVVDVDEFLWRREHLRGWLERRWRDGVTIFRPVGLDMYHHRFPTTEGQIYQEVRRYQRAHGFDKLCLFDPNRIAEMAYTAGCHVAHPRGHILLNHESEGLRLLHFKHMGLEYLIQRFGALRTKLKPLDVQRGMGRQYGWSPEELTRRYASWATTEDDFCCKE